VVSPTLEGNRLIRAARGHITVLDRAGLEDVADSAYGAQKPNTPASWGRHTVVPCSSMNRRYRERLFRDEEGDERAHEPALREHGLTRPKS
jgi:hypothetical protein